jgi:hypothetical protein
LLDQDKETVYEDELPNYLVIPDFLLSFNLLRRSKDEMGRCTIGFQYDHIRNYVISFHSLKLDKLADSEIIALMDENMDKALARNLFYYFSKVSDEKRKHVIQKEFSAYNFKRAVAFVDSYQQTLDTEFSHIKDRFYPFTNEKIGLLVFYHSDTFYRPEYGFREIKEDQPKVIWLEKENWFEKGLENELHKIAQSYSVETMFILSLDFTVVEPSDCARTLIIDRLKKIIEGRQLDESYNDNLLIEYILEETRKYARNWRLIKDPFSWKEIFPLDVEKIIQKVSEQLEQLRNFCESRGYKAYELPPELLKLYYSLRIIKHKQATIDRTLLPYPAKSTIPLLGAVINEYTDQEMVEYLFTLFSLVLHEFRVLAETNFPKIKDSMETYKLLPTRVIGEIEKNGDQFFAFNYCIIPAENGEKFEIKIKGVQSIFDPESMTVQTAKRKISIKRYSRSVMFLFFESDLGRDNIVQKRVYSMIFEDLKALYAW